MYADSKEQLYAMGIIFMLALCDKILVLCHGEVMGVVHAAKTTKEKLGLMMTGSLNLLKEQAHRPWGKAKDSSLTEEEWENLDKEENAEESLEQQDENKEEVK